MFCHKQLLSNSGLFKILIKFQSNYNIDRLIKKTNILSKERKEAVDICKNSNFNKKLFKQDLHISSNF